MLTFLTANSSRSSKHSPALNLTKRSRFSGEDCGALQKPPNTTLQLSSRAHRWFQLATLCPRGLRLNVEPLCAQLLASNALPAENEPMSVSIEEILNLSVKKRLELIEEIWDSIASNQEAIPLTSAQRRELDRRRSVHRADPSAAVPWTEVRSRLQKRKK